MQRGRPTDCCPSTCCLFCSSCLNFGHRKVNFNCTGSEGVGKSAHRQTMGAAQGAGTRGVSQRARSPQDRIDIRSCRRCDAAELAAVRLGFLPLSRTGAGFPDHSPHHPSYPATSGLRSRPGTQNANALTCFACVMQEIGAGGCESRHTQIAPMSGTAFLEI